MGKIQNLHELASTPLRKAVLEIAEAGLQSIDTKKVIQEGLANLQLPLEEAERLFVVGIGKCAVRGVLALEEELGDKITDGFVLDIQEAKFAKVHFLKGDHPFSTERDKQATKKIIDLLDQTTERDAVLFLISGGGSALLCQPESHTCEDEIEVIGQLFRKGATIQELNTVRKHLSLARGGYLARYAYPAQVISLIFSDVPGDELGFISSGPTVLDTTSKEDAQKVLQQHGLEQYAPYLIETPKEAKYFEKVKNILFVSNRIALQAMERKAAEFGFSAHIQTAELAGEARKVGERIVGELHVAPGKSVLLYGGETTVTIEHEGKGGRNLELGLSGLRRIGEQELIFPFASDGRDNTEYAGALCDMVTKAHAEAKKLDLEEYLKSNQSFSFFEQTGDYVMTGNTGSNVSDLIIAIKV